MCSGYTPFTFMPLEGVTFLKLQLSMTAFHRPQCCCKQIFVSCENSSVRPRKPASETSQLAPHLSLARALNDLSDVPSSTLVQVYLGSSSNFAELVSESFEFFLQAAYLPSFPLQLVVFGEEHEHGSVLQSQTAHFFAVRAHRQHVHVIARRLGHTASSVDNLMAAAGFA